MKKAVNSSWKYVAMKIPCILMLCFCRVFRDFYSQSMPYLIQFFAVIFYWSHLYMWSNSYRCCYQWLWWLSNVRRLHRFRMWRGPALLDVGPCNDVSCGIFMVCIPASNVNQISSSQQLKCFGKTVTNIIIIINIININIIIIIIIISIITIIITIIIIHSLINSFNLETYIANNQETTTQRPSQPSHGQRRLKRNVKLERVLEGNIIIIIIILYNI